MSRHWRLVTWRPDAVHLFIYQLSGHRPAQRECAGTELRAHARCHPYPIPQPVKVGHTTGSTTPTLFEKWCGFFYVPQEQISESAVRRDLRCFVLIREDYKVKPFADVITKAALSSQLFKDPECWSGRGLNPRPPARQTGALPTELTRRQL